MMIRTLMLSVATSALTLSPALAQDGQTSGETGESESVTVPLDTEATVTITEEIQVPIEGEVTIDVNVTEVEADPAAGSEGEESAQAEGDQADSDEMDQAEGDQAEGDATAGAEGETGAEGTSGEQSADQGLSVADDQEQSAEDGDDQQGLSVAEDEGDATTSGQGEDGGMAEGDTETEGGASGTGMAEGDTEASEESGDVAAEGDASGEGLSVEEEDGTGVAEGDDQSTQGGSEPVEGEFVSDEQLEEGAGTAATDEAQTGAEAEQDGMSAETEQDGMSAEAESGPDYGPFADMTVDDILSMPVESTDERRVGDIDYLIRREGRIEVVIGVGGFLGLNEYTVALPLEEFELVDDGDRLFISYTEDELTSMPEIDESGLESLDGDLRIADIAAQG
ncbi:PRC-barrel domain-containing protein [Histidinibacterium lentulum]|uniref:PRC-barrel domain-containing protein n=1 Tax=Histidinibacterium lentulum TaxID=2480588 RepID=A0A3N2R738_9RHOB|nr:PRC-barrel domain-containing protein [Histidinibacterium lentulum]ROU03191.1 hypothetical protein EAT49_07840 [Histidinibacterium lentulum]